MTKVHRTETQAARERRPGWESMLLEDMGPAVDRASETAAVDCGDFQLRVVPAWG
jgi:hypothetical protein